MGGGVACWTLTPGYHSLAYIFWPLDVAIALQLFLPSEDASWALPATGGPPGGYPGQSSTAWAWLLHTGWRVNPVANTEACERALDWTQDMSTGALDLAGLVATSVSQAPALPALQDPTATVCDSTQLLVPSLS